MKKFLSLLIFLLTSPILANAVTTPTIVGFATHPNGTSVNTNMATTSYKMPYPAQSGQAAVAVLTSEDSPITNLTVTDDKSDTCTQEVNLYDGGSPSRVLAIYVCPSLTAGAQLFTDTEATGGGFDQLKVMYVNNIAASSFMDGTCSGTVTTGTSMTCGSGITTSTAGDLVLSCAFVDTFSSTPSTSVQFSKASGFTLLPEDGTTPVGCQWIVQSSAGAISPTLTMSQAVTLATTVGVAIKASSGTRGSTPSGTYIASFQAIAQNSVITASGTTFKIQSPCLPNVNGIAIAEMAENDASSISDGTNSFTGRGTFEFNSSTAYGIRFWTADGITCVADELITITTSVSNGGSDYFVLQIVGDGGYDATAGAVGTGSGNDTRTSFPLNLDTAAITPSTANGLVLGCINSQNQSSTGMHSSGYDMQINPNDSTPAWIYEGLLMDQDGGFLIYSDPTANSAYTPSYIYSKTQSGFADIAAWENQTIAIKSQATNSVFEDDSWFGGSSQKSADGIVVIWGFIFGLMLAGWTLTSPFIHKERVCALSIPISIVYAINSSRFVDGAVRVAQIGPTTEQVFYWSGIKNKKLDN